MLKWVEPVFRPTLVPQEAGYEGPRVRELLVSVQSRARVAGMMEVLARSFDFLVCGYVSDGAGASPIIVCTECGQGDNC